MFSSSNLIIVKISSRRLHPKFDDPPSQIFTQSFDFQKVLFIFNHLCQQFVIWKVIVTLMHNFFISLFLLRYLKHVVVFTKLSKPLVLKKTQVSYLLIRLTQVDETQVSLISENVSEKVEITLTESWVVVLLCARYNDFAVKRQFCWKPRHFVAVLRSDLVTLSRKNGFISTQYSL